MSRVLARPHPACLRLGWVRVLQADPLAFDTLVAQHPRWRDEAGLGDSPLGNPQPSKRAETLRCPLRWGLVDEQKQETLLGGVVKALAPYHEGLNPYVWNGVAQLAGLLVVLSVNGDLIGEVLRDWPEGEEQGGAALEMRVGRALQTLSQSPSGVALFSRWAAMGSAERLDRIILPALEPLRELSLLTAPAHGKRKVAQYRITRAGAHFAATWTRAGTEALLVGGALESLGALWLEMNGRDVAREADGAEILACLDEVPESQWISGAELPVETLAWCAMAKFGKAGGGIYTDPRRTLGALQAWRRGHPGLIELRSGQSITDISNLIVTDRKRLEEVLAGASMDLADPPETSPGEPPPQEGPTPHTPATDPINGVEPEGNADTPASSEPPESDRLATRWLRLVEWLCAELSPGHPLGLAPASLPVWMGELEAMVRRTPFSQLATHRDLSWCPLNDPSLVWPAPRGQGKSTPAADPRPRAPVETAAIRAIQVWAPGRLGYSSSPVAGNSPAWRAEPFRDWVSAWQRPEEPKGSLQVRLRACAGAVQQEVERAFALVEAWLSLTSESREEELWSECVDATKALLVWGQDVDRFVWQELASGVRWALGETEDSDADRSNKQPVRLRAMGVLTRLRPDASAGDSAATTPVCIPLELHCTPGEQAEQVNRAKVLAQELGLELDEADVQGPVLTKRDGSRSTHGHEAPDSHQHPLTAPRTAEELSSRLRRRVAERWRSAARREGISLLPRATPRPAGSGPFWRSLPADGYASAVDPAVRRLRHAESLELPADRVLQLWIAMEGVHSIERERVRLLSAGILVDYVAARTRAELELALETAVMGWIRKDTLVDGAEALVRGVLKAADVERIEGWRRQPSASRRTVKLSGKLEAPGANLWASLDQHNVAWRLLMEGSRCAVTRAMFGALQGPGLAEKDLAPLVRELWLDAVSLVQRIYTQRNRIVHDGAGLEDEDQPRLERLAQQGFAVIHPVLIKAAGRPKSELFWDQALNYAREMSWTLPMSQAELSSRRAHCLGVEQIERWFGGGSQAP